MPDSAWERYRRAALRLPDHRGGGRRTGHAALFALSEVVDVGELPEGGGFPARFLQRIAYPTLGVSDPARVLHICSGSVRAPYTVDRRASVRPAVVADARALPILAGSFEWAIADPPYSRQWAKTLYGISARQYPTPGGIVREAMRVLRPGGRLGLLHYMVPPHVPGACLVGVWGITIGPGSTIRAWSVLERVGEPELPRSDPVHQLRPAELVAVTKPAPGYARPGVQAQVSSRPCACGCGAEVDQPATGRPRLYATAGCRQRAYRRRGADHGSER